MPETTTQEMELLKKELADVSTFVKERVEPVHDERVRLRKAIEALTKEQQDYRRSALLNGSQNGSQSGSRGDAVVKSGPYAGCDELDLSIVRSVQRAAETQMGHDSVRDWDMRLKAAMDSVTAGRGDEIVPTGMASRLWDDVNQETRVASLFNRIDMPTNPFDIPLQLGDVNWYPGVENTGVTNSVPKTAHQTLTAYELVAEVPWSLTLDEDAVFAVLPEVRQTLIRNAAEVIDDVLLNADQTATNSINADGGTVSATSPGMAHFLIGFDGLLHLPLVDNTGQSMSLAGNILSSAYLSALKKLGKYGLSQSETVFITDVATFTASLGLSSVETVDKLGPKATIRTGQLGSIYGHPLIVSGQMRIADSDGKVSDGGNDSDRGRILAVNTSQWRVGFRRSLMIETQRDIQKRQNVMVVSMRLGFAERSGDRTKAKHTALVYNITQ